jgi:cytochrome P450
MSRDLLGTLARWQADYGDVVHLRIWPEHELLITDPQRVREVLVRHHDSLIRWERGVDVFAQAHGHSVFTSEGADWARKRQALQPSFSGRAVAEFAPAIVAATDRALARWPATHPAWPIESALTTLAMDVILQLLFSADVGTQGPALEQAVHTLLQHAHQEFFYPASLPHWLPWNWPKRRALHTLHQLIDHHIQARQAQPAAQGPDDLLGRLLALHQADPHHWPLQAVRDECMSTFLAGHETTSATLAWWAWAMATHPQAQHQARSEVQDALGPRPPGRADLGALGYLQQTLHETLRLYPAAPLLATRRTRHPIRIGPWQVPAGTLLLLPTHTLHHDPRWFAEPEAFRPERFAPQADAFPRGAHLPFGAGPRVCLGQHLALTEMTVITARLLQRYQLHPTPGQGAPEAEFRISLRPRVGLRVGLTAV